MSKIILSYSTLNDYTQASHTYICKLMGLKPPDNIYMTMGRKIHDIVEDHCLEIKKHPLLTGLWNFMEKENHIKKNADNDKYLFHSYIDLVNWKSKVISEIKSSKELKGQPWFGSLIQGKYYCWVMGFNKMYFVSVKTEILDYTPEKLKEMTKEQIERIQVWKSYYQEYTPEELKEAEIWAYKALKGIDDGEFKGGLDENGKCTGCNYRENCYFA